MSFDKHTYYEICLNADQNPEIQPEAEDEWLHIILKEEKVNENILEPLKTHERRRNEADIENLQYDLKYSHNEGLFYD